MMMMTVPMPNPMVPNSSRLTSAVSPADASIDTTTGTSTATTTTARSRNCVPMLHPEDPNLYCIPSDLSPTYQSLPFRLRMVLGIVSTYIFASRSLILKTTLELFKTSAHIGIVWWYPVRFVHILLTHSAWAKKHVIWDLFKIGIKSYIVYAMSTIFVQDVVLTKYAPSRISTSDLVSKYRILPSTYSYYEPLRTNFNLSNVPFHFQPNVHYLKAIGNHSAVAATTTSSLNMDAIYVNHGFGASSLSWLPAIPSLLPHTKVVLGHDAPGFGFTDRWSNRNHSSPSQVQQDHHHPQQQQQASYYSISHSATIGTALLRNHIPEENHNMKTNTNVLLMGHSLGSLTTLRMALQQQNCSEIQQHIILVSPAVGFRKSKSNVDASLRIPTTTTAKTSNSKNAMPQPTLPRTGRRGGIIPLFVRRPLQRIGTSVACYGLKRLVGQTNFWRNGLQQGVWNNKRDPKRKLRDCDVLRYQWPAIVQDWEIGLVQFASGQVSSTSRKENDESVESEVELIQSVLDVPNVKSIHVIVGSNDRVIPNATMVQFFREHFPNQINVTIMDGFGHNPFEEDPELFVQTLQAILLKVKVDQRIG